MKAENVCLTKILNTMGATGIYACGEWVRRRSGAVLVEAGISRLQAGVRSLRQQRFDSHNGKSVTTCLQEKRCVSLCFQVFRNTCHGILSAPFCMSYIDTCLTCE